MTYLDKFFWISGMLTWVSFLIVAMWCFITAGDENEIDLDSDDVVARDEVESFPTDWFAYDSDAAVFHRIRNSDTCRAESTDTEPTGSIRADHRATHTRIGGDTEWRPTDDRTGW